MILVEKAQYNSCCFFVVKRSKNYKWSYVKTFKFVCYCFYCLTSNFFLFSFVFARQILMILPFFELSGLKGNVLFMEIYIPAMKSSILSLTKCAIFM